MFLAHFGAHNSAQSGRDLLIIAPIVFGTDCALLETYDDQIRRAYWRWAASMGKCPEKFWKEAGFSTERSAWTFLSSTSRRKWTTECARR